MRFPRWLVASLAGLASCTVVSLSAEQALGAPAAGGPLRAAHANHSQLGRFPVAIHDKVIGPHAGARAASRALSGYGGPFRASNGDLVNVYLSPSFIADATVNQSWAEFFSQLPHGPELASVTVYLAPYDEMQSLCGSDTADSCYDASSSLIVLVGEVPPDGTPIEEAAAHEYGHHIANSRNNYPWPAFDWGPKRWASYEGVCPNTANGAYFPGDEGDNYASNPGEGFAESYRVFSGGSTTDWRVDQSFFPNQNDFALISQDIYSPWNGNTVFNRSGRFVGRRGHPVRWYKINTFDDGVMHLTLNGARRTDFDLYLFDNRSNQLASSRSYSSHEQINYTICGEPYVWAAVQRYTGRGSFSLRISRP